MKIRILTWLYLVNNGSVLLAYATLKAIEQHFPDADVKILDYSLCLKKVPDQLKVFLLHRKVPFFNLMRYLTIRKFIRYNLRLDKDIPHIAGYKKALETIRRSNFDVLVIGSEAVWRLTNKLFEPRFPNVYWLANDILSKKVAFGSTAHQGDLRLYEKYKESIRESLNGFNLIGVRDDFTLDMVKKVNIDKKIPLLKIPDPTFRLDIDKTEVDKILVENGIGLDRPILGMLVYGKELFSQRVTKYFRERGFQIIALSMYNAYADVNLGHVLDPFQWADVFKHLTFCITDRFHGTVFCLKSNIPFIGIEPQPIPIVCEKNSKIYSLLKDFNMLECHSNIHSEEIDIIEFLKKCSDLLNSWDKKYKDHVTRKVQEMRDRSLDFLRSMEEVISA